MRLLENVPRCHSSWVNRVFSEGCLGPTFTKARLAFRVRREMGSQEKHLVQVFPSSKGDWS